MITKISLTHILVRKAVIGQFLDILGNHKTATDISQKSKFYFSSTKPLKIINVNSV